MIAKIRAFDMLSSCKTRFLLVFTICVNSKSKTLEMSVYLSRKYECESIVQICEGVR